MLRGAVVATCQRFRPSTLAPQPATKSILTHQTKLALKLCDVFDRTTENRLLSNVLLNQLATQTDQLVGVSNSFGLDDAFLMLDGQLRRQTEIWAHPLSPGHDARAIYQPVC